MRKTKWDFPGGPVAKDLPANAGAACLIPGLGRVHMLQGSVGELLSAATAES